MARILFLLVLALFPAHLLAAAPPAEVSRTGQTGCWDDGGKSVTCDGTGQDGAIRAGIVWPTPRLVDNGNGTVSDNLTGLVWLKNANCYGLQNWYNALGASNTLANGGCGLTDGSKPGQWRLPNRVELESLIDSQQGGPALVAGAPFTNLQSDYWTSSSYAPVNYYAWRVNLLTGQADVATNFSSISTLPVRDGVGVTPVAKLPATGQTVSQSAGDDGALKKGAAWPVPRFTDNGNQTITDNLTGLIWSKDAQSPGPAACTPGGVKNWSGALAHVACLNSNSYLTFTDWRLPNRRELASLINQGELDNAAWLSLAGFTKLQGGALSWSSTTVAGSPLKAWSLLPATGRIDGEGKLFSHVVWPVRGGVITLYGNLTVTPASGDFGSITVGQVSTPQTFTLGNTGKGDLKVSAITIAGGSSSSFTVNPGSGSDASCGASPTIKPGKSCDVAVTFKPTSAGAKNAVLRVGSNDPDTPQVDTPLTGTGLLPVYTVSTSVIGGHGDIACTSPVTKGGTSFCTITPEDGYFLATFTDNGVSKISLVTTSYAITKIAVDHAIVGTFSQTPPPLDGMCGFSNGATLSSAPTTSLCLKGAPSLVTGTGPWQWTCSGVNGGKSVSCSANKSGPPPVLINDGAAYATSSAVLLTLIPPAGEDLVRLSNDGLKWGKWLPIVNPLKWKLAAKDGLKFVYAQFRKSGTPDGGTYEAYSDGIILDSKPPKGTLRINGGAKLTNNPTLQLSLTATDLTSDVEGVCLQEVALPCQSAEFIPFAGQLPFTLKGGDGKRTVYATLRDMAGKLSKPLKGSITLDTTPPVGSVTINNGSTTSTTPAVSLKLTAPGATQMRLSLDGGESWGAWEKFAASRKIVLPATSGSQTVGAFFMDVAGNVSTPSFASIEVMP